jgi:N-methylhydantoinase A
VEPPEFAPSTTKTTTDPVVRSQRVVLTESEGPSNYSVFHRDDLTFGQRISVPAIVAEHTSTTVLHKGDGAEVGSFGELVITIGGVK